MSIVVMHIRYLPIVDRYDLHQSHQCDDDDRACREVHMRQELVDILRNVQDMAKGSYNLCRDLYDSGSH